MRFAFLTPEYATSTSSAGGLANFVVRTTTALVQQGHEVDVMALADSNMQTNSQGVQVFAYQHTTSLLEKLCDLPRRVTPHWQVQQLLSERRIGKRRVPAPFVLK